MWHEEQIKTTVTFNAVVHTVSYSFFNQMPDGSETVSVRCNLLMKVRSNEFPGIRTTRRTH